MRKYTWTIFFIMFMAAAFAQEKIDTYKSAILYRNFNIRAKLDSNKKAILYLEVFNGILVDKYYFKIEDNLPFFVDALTQAKSKFLEWKKYSKENKINQAIKPMDIVFPSVSIYFYDSFDKKFTYIEDLELMPIFNVTGYNDFRFQLSALSVLVEDQAYSIILTRAKEFDKLITRISPDRLLAKLSNDSK